MIVSPPDNARSAIFRAGIAWSELEPWNMPECRKYFLLGMTDQSPLLVRDVTGFETFWPSEERAETLYGTVAKLYAHDLGIKDGEMSPAVWKRAVMQSLQPRLNQSPLLQNLDGKWLIAYLAGVHARHGTNNGFRFSGTGRGFEIGGIIARHGIDDVKLEASPGFPGGSSITLTGQDGRRSQLLTLLEWVEAGVQKEADQKLPGKTSAP